MRFQVSIDMFAGCKGDFLTRQCREWYMSRLMQCVISISSFTKQLNNLFSDRRRFT